MALVGRSNVGKSSLINHLLNHKRVAKRASLRLILLLIDARRDPSPDDLLIFQWAKQRSIPLLVILTKTDKLSSFELKAKMNASNALLGDCIPFNIYDHKESRRKLIDAIQKRIEL